jgi:hypothetical protein
MNDTEGAEIQRKGAKTQRRKNTKKKIFLFSAPCLFASSRLCAFALKFRIPIRAAHEQPPWNL